MSSKCSHSTYMKLYMLPPESFKSQILRKSEGPAEGASETLFVSDSVRLPGTLTELQILASG